MLVIILFFCIPTSISAFESCGLSGCDPKCLREHLKDLKLISTIENNGDLLDNIKNIYGVNVYLSLLEKHPKLNDRKGVFDIKTLKWFRKQYFNDNFSLGKKYIIFPFLNHESNKETFISAIIGRAYPLYTSIPIFINNKQLDEMKSIFKENNYELVKKKLRLLYDIENEGKLKKISIKLYDDIFKKKHINLELLPKDELTKLSGHYVTIIGHGSPGTEFIYDSTEDERNSLSSSEVIKLLKENKIPSSINIELLHCFGAVGEIDVPTDKTKKELIELVKKNEITKILGDQTSSYGFKFSKEIYKQWPNFTGSVVAYQGEVLAAPDLALIRSSTNQFFNNYALGVGLQDKDGNYVDFEQSELTTIYNRLDF